MAHSPPLTMSENFQGESFFGTECALESSVPVLRNGTPSADSTCDFSRVSTSAVTSAWLLPADSGICGQQLTDSVYLYQQDGTAMLPGLTNQSQIYTSALSYPDVLQWDLTGSADWRQAAFTVTIIDQNTTLSSLSMTAQCDNTLDPNAIVPFYPTVSASLVQATSSQVPSQGYSLVPSYQESSQVYYYDLNPLGPLVTGELRQCLQVCGSGSYSGSLAPALQPEMVMVLKEIQPTNGQTSLSASAIYGSTSAQAVPDTSLQGVEMETSLGLTSSSQTLCLMQNPDLCDAGTQDVQMKTPPDDGDMARTALTDRPLELLTLPPAPALEQTENSNLDEIVGEQSTPLNVYEGTRENQDVPLLPLAPTDTQQPLSYPGAESLTQKLAPDDATLGSSRIGQEETGDVQTVIHSGVDFADMTALVADVHLSQLFNALTDLNQFQDDGATQSKDVRSDEDQESSRVIRVPSDQVSMNDQKASELLDGAPQVRIQLQDLVDGDETVMSSVGDTEGAIDDLAKPMESEDEKVTSSRPGPAGVPAPVQDKIKKNNSKKTEELKRLRTRGKAEERPAIPKTKRKKNPPELSQDSFKKPRTHLGRHMLESVQVFHPLGKKSEKKTGISSSRVLQNVSSNRDARPGPAPSSLLDVPHEGRGPDKTLAKALRAESSAQEECPSPSQYELPPPGKVKLVPLPFPALTKPQARPVSRKPLSLASHRPAATCSAMPHSHAAQPTTLKPSRTAPASTPLMASDKLALPTAPSATRSNLNATVQSCPGSQPAASRVPAPYRASSHASLQRELVSASRNRAPPPPKHPTQYLLQDFSRQPIPWRKVDIPGPVISQPITEEQRPEREAMKRRAQQERENAAKFTALGKLQLFLQREKDMEISRHYGYAM